jgi:phosphonate transport system permease protein
MLRVVLIFLAVGLFSLGISDFAVLTLSPETELGKIANGFVKPSFTRAFEVAPSFAVTLSLALAAVLVAAFVGTILAPWYHRLPIRVFATLCRSVHELFWAILLMPLFRLSPFCGALALIIPFSGIFIKIYREIFDESDKSPLGAIPAGTGKISTFFYGVLPGVLLPCWKYTVYRIECGMRSSAVLGFLGIPTVGFYLETMFTEGEYNQAAGILYCFFIMVWAVRTIVPWFLLVLGSMYSLVSVLSTFEMAKNINQFFYELLPWPLRGEQSWSDWSSPLWEALAIGVPNTIVLSVVTVFATGVIAAFLFPLASRVFVTPVTRHVAEISFIVARTTPELIIAYVLLIAFGPSMLPAFIAMTIHNVAIIAHLAGGWSEEHAPKIGTSKRKLDTFFYWVMPRMFGQYLAYLLYRWEVVIRESALLGIIGVYTLGFFIDAAIHKDHLDVALGIVFVSSLLTLMVDGISHLVRKYLHISGVVHSRASLA